MGAFILIVVIIVGNADGVAVSQQPYSTAAACQVAAKAISDMQLHTRMVQAACVPG
jgi:hypothetical protein